MSILGFGTILGVSHLDRAFGPFHFRSILERFGTEIRKRQQTTRAGRDIYTLFRVA